MDGGGGEILSYRNARDSLQWPRNRSWSLAQRGFLATAGTIGPEQWARKLLLRR